MSDRIPLCEPHLAGNALRYLEECVATNYVSSVGPFVERFEREFAAYVGARHAVACASGTAAIHVALRVCGVAPGDEVLVPTLTFVASANPVRYQGATPLLVDVEPSTWNGDPALIVEELERRARLGLRQPKVVEIVHLLGHPADLEPIAAACERHGVTLVEDAAEALGARYTAGAHAGRHVGTLGRVGCFSFNGNKIITCGGGGMIVTDDERLARHARHLTTQARLPGPFSLHDEIGFNYRLTNLAAALGVAQLELLPEFLARKRAIAARYDGALSRRPGLRPHGTAPWAAPSGWMYSLRVDAAAFGATRDALMERLEHAGIASRPIWAPLHLMPMYRDAPRLGGAVAEAIAGDALSLPCSADLAPEAQDRVIDALLRPA